MFCNDIIDVCLSTHYNFYIYFLLGRIERNDASVYGCAVNCHCLNALLNIRRILNRDVVGCASEFTCDLEIAEAVRYAGINLKTLVGRIYAEDVLADVAEGPCSGSGEPAVLAFAGMYASLPATIWQYT